MAMGVVVRLKAAIKVAGILSEDGGIIEVTDSQKEDCVLANGTVKWFNNRKGYGFINEEDGRDIFVHFSSIEMEGYKTLNEGERVTFEIEESDRGPEAKNVRRI